MITDPQEICNRFNEFFVGIGPKLANNINTENKDVFRAFITKRISTSFTFTLIKQAEVKTTNVLSLYKKGDPTLIDNHIPVSLLPSISKMFEKKSFYQLYKYFQDNKLFYPSQYGSREGHSTETAALKLPDRIRQDIDSKYISLAISMDLSKSFDTLDHTILLNKLSYYGVGGNDLNWFSSYLSDRQQYV